MAVVSISWADHLTFGSGDGRLDTPEAVNRRMAVWRGELGATALHWRLLRARIPGRFSAARGYRHPSQDAARRLCWNDLAIVPSLARDAGLVPWLYVSLFDEGWPLAPPRARAVSHHNLMHGQHVAWQSTLTREHPEWVMVDRRGMRQWGVVCLAYASARRAFIDRWLQLLEGTVFEGLFVCLRSQSRPADHGDQFGFNEPVRQEFLRRHRRDILTQSFDVHAWRDLLGESLTMFLRELREALRARGRRLSVGVPRGDVLGPPLGNATLAWREWLREGTVDALVIDQNSCQCPSMWHRLWPMHRGTGYVQNYLEDSGLPPLEAHVREHYAPESSRAGRALLIARQWCERSPAVERRLQAIPGVSGLVFSSFRHDNPAALQRGDWRAGAITPGRT